tara:strand:+ start:274 stop:561 length:288 start_codon:yes stop_codon:yes gene_type:complete
MSKFKVYDETITAVNKKNQSLVNKATTWLNKYHTSNDARDLAYDSNEHDSEWECKTWKKYNRLCNHQWDVYTMYLDELPKYEIKNIEKSKLYLNN